MNKKQKEELKIELNNKYESLCDNIVTDPEEIEKFVKIFTGGFHQHSIRNMILAWLQCPQVSLMAGYNAWQKRGRQVIKGQKAIRIYAPNTRKRRNENTDEEEYYLSGFRLAATFDVSQTGVPKTISTPDGRTFDVIDPMDMQGVEVGAAEYISGPNTLHFEDFVKDTNLPVNVKANMETSNGNTGGNDINIAERKNDAAMITTLFHEEMHNDLGHTKDDCKISREVKEVTAEAGAYLVSTFFGIENNKSAYYIGNWGGNKELLIGRGAEVMRAAEKIIKRHLETVTIAISGVEPAGVESHA